MRRKCLLPLLAILLFSLPAITQAADTKSTCTDELFRKWTDGKGKGATISGASVTAGIGTISLYDAPKGRPIKEKIRFSQGYAVAEIRRTFAGGTWLRLRSPQQRWFDARTEGLVCGRMRPIREERDDLALKVVAGLGVNKSGQLLQGLDAPRRDASGIGKISVYRHYFVFAKRQGSKHPDCEDLTNDPDNREWWLLGERQLPLIRDSGLVGWFPACRLIPWKTRQVVRPVSGTVFRAENGEEAVSTGDLEDVYFALLGRTGPDYRVAFHGEGDGGVSYRDEATARGATAEVHPRYENPSVVFLVDGTASTRPHLAYMRKALRSIQDELTRQYGRRIRYALAAYRDAKHGIKRHFQIYSGLTSDLDILLNAKLPALQNDTRAWSAPSGDDFQEDLFYGLVRVLEDLLPRSGRKKTLPIIVVLGDMGSHERSVDFSQLAEKRDKAVHLIFFQTPSDRDSIPGDKRTAYDVAYKAFEEQANRLRDQGPFTVMKPHVGLQPEEIVQVMANDLRNMAQTGKKLPRLSQEITAGAAVEDALDRVNWPVEWRPGFIAALGQANFPDKYIEQRRFQMVVPARVSQGQVEVRVMIDKDDFRRWTTALEALAINPELWDPGNLASQLGDALQKVTGERPGEKEPLNVFLRRTLDLPARTAILTHSLEEIAKMSPQALASRFDYLSHVVERFRMIANGVIRESRQETDGLTGEVRWVFYDRERDYDPWKPAGNRRWIAYLPMEYLP
uniref:VWFA domain-containing protein n=1 Tax=Candidatus Kentrum sp. LPFa TaxID=2126335 RepID=A0A450XK86_9GAMM|nr:MAG: hypothetical protein BECKLPF1236A_GA0070988_100914 [Candidatus Kentron sp. LPFa]VFK29639.1 MAG: hypothetical protein BECKLPF1236C_GA0070990_100914 [Candidatus Kentron sp. LPFa]